MASEDTSQYDHVEIITEYSTPVYSEKSTASKRIENTDNGEVYGILRQETDNHGVLWYQIEMFVNSFGWVPAASCRKTSKEVTIPVRSNPGELLNPAIDTDLLLKLLAVRDGKAESFIKVLGSGYTKNVREIESLSGRFTDIVVFYTYSDDLFLECDSESNVVSFSIGEDTYYLENNVKITADITSDPGDEILYYNHVGNFGELLVVKGDSSTVIGNYRFSWPGDDEEWLRVGDFCGTGSNQIFYGQKKADYYDDYYYPNLSLLFTVGSDGTLTAILDNAALFSRLQNASASILDKTLTLDIEVDDYGFSQTCRLPDAIFYNNINFPDKNSLLHKIIHWDVDSVDAKWYILVDCIVFFDMCDAYWGLPVPNDDSGCLINDLARTRFVFEFVDGKLELRGADPVIKYQDAGTDTALVECDELNLDNGIFLRQKKDEAFRLLPEAPVVLGEFEYTVTSDGVTLIAEDYLVDVPEVSDIIVTSPKYPTKRGIRVGDPIEKVESLYGKPHQGLPGDEESWYYASFEYKGNILTTYSIGIVFSYEDGKVASYHLYEHYRD